MANEDFRQEVMSNKSSALVVLNTLSVKKGEILNIRYTMDSGSIDSLVAVGIKDGVGPDCYTMVSDQSIPLVNSITDVRPDVSDMISGTIFIPRHVGREVPAVIPLGQFYYREGVDGRFLLYQHRGREVLFF